MTERWYIFCIAQFWRMKHAISRHFDKEIFLYIAGGRNYFIQYVINSNRNCYWEGWEYVRYGVLII
jgi:hypothetical protein